MSTHEQRKEARRQQLREQGRTIAAQLLTLAGVKADQRGADVEESEQQSTALQEVLYAVFEELEAQGWRFDPSHPEGFEITLQCLIERFEYRLKHDDWESIV